MPSAGALRSFSSRGAVENFLDHHARRESQRRGGDFLEGMTASGLIAGTGFILAGSKAPINVFCPWPRWNSSDADPIRIGDGGRIGS
jgi:hypothetical protein